MPELPVSSRDVESLGGWGNYPTAPARLVRPEKMSELRLLKGGQIPRGMGRSYGDAALNSEGATILTTRLNRLLAFEPITGVLKAEAGTTLDEVIHAFVPHGWFLPVTPGTRYCSLGGCLAADVHGKNHHRAGTFSSHVTEAVVRTADGECRTISREENADLFWATAGGMGLTGVIEEVSLKLHPIETAYMDVRHTRVRTYVEAMDLMADPSTDDDYSVTWVDCFAKNRSLGRGIAMTAHHMVKGDLPLKMEEPLKLKVPKEKAVPFDFPNWALNSFTLSFFNSIYDWAKGRKKSFRAPILDYFYPLDAVHHWNRVYGKRGFVQFQCAIPNDGAREGMGKILGAIAEGRHASFLAVLKRFGPREKGLLSFPMEGWTLSLDLPMKEGLLDFLKELDRMVIDYGGTEYLAKDARLEAAAFHQMEEGRLPAFREALARFDPEGKFASDLSRRLELRS